MGVNHSRNHQLALKINNLGLRADILFRYNVATDKQDNISLYRDRFTHRILDIGGIDNTIFQKHYLQTYYVSTLLGARLNNKPSIAEFSSSATDILIVQD